MEYKVKHHHGNLRTMLIIKHDLLLSVSHGLFHILAVTSEL